MKTAKADGEIMNILKVSEISRVICDTNMGTLKLRIRKGETDYKFVLDAVELPKDLNSELMEAIYPKPMVNGYLEPITITPEMEKIITNNFKPKGRPKGSLNKKKTIDKPN